MPEMLIGLALTLVVFSFLLAVLYFYNRRKDKTPHIHTCAHCTCDRKDSPAVRDALKRKAGQESIPRVDHIGNISNLDKSGYARTARNRS